MALVITPQQNGVSERCHRHLVETSLTLLHDASLPLSYWPHAFSTATYLINRQSTPLLHNKSPFEALFHQPPTILNSKNSGVYVFLSPSPITHISCSPRRHHVCLWAIPQPRMRINVLTHKPTNYIYLSTFCLTKVKPILSSV